MHRLSLDVKQEDIILFHRHIPLLTSGETLSGKKKYVPSPLRGCVGHYHEFAALLVVSQTHAFFFTIMVNNINNFGVINFYENNSTKTNNQSRQAEDIIPIPEHFKHITQKCIDEKRIDAVDAEIRAACKGTAEGLWRTLWNNENLGYVEVEHIDATTLYKDIEERYGKLPYTERNFRHARSKRYDN